MLIAENIQGIRTHIANARSSGWRVGLVPTMGALHEGHTSLIQAARRECGFVVVSIFVNPTQFAPGEDFDRYPRPIERDLEACRQAGAGAVFTPSVQEIYGPSNSTDDAPATRTTIHVAGLSDAMCGPFRPGHFDGVATVVAKLLNIVQPDAAYFGEKDYQQLQIIRRMVRDLNMPIEIVGCPTVREPDGLAMSSRNAYLSPSDRRQAASIFAALSAAAHLASERLSQQGNQKRANVLASDLTIIARRVIEAAGPCNIEYVSLVDAESLAELPELDRPARLCTAVRIGKTRLIDNIAIGPTQ